MKRMIALSRCIGVSLHGSVSPGFSDRPAEAAMQGDHGCVRLGHHVDRLRLGMGMPPEIFTAAVRPVIDAYRHTHAACGGAPACHASSWTCPVLQRLMVTGRALDYRRGRILPPHTAPEDIGERTHRWTYAVFVAGLLFVDRQIPVASASTESALDLQGVGADPIPIRGGASLRACEGSLDGMLLFRRIVPDAVQVWLAADPILLDELQRLLSGDAAARVGALGLLITRAAAAVSGAETEVPADRVGAAVTQVPAQTPPVPADQASTAAATDGADDPAGHAIAGDAAQRFMQWVRCGIAEGRLPVNQADALVHFVAEGMLLVSPRIFKVFARQWGEDGAGPVTATPFDETRLGLGIQRQVLRAGWHRLAANGINIHRYAVLRSGKPGATLSGVLIAHPERFLEAVPPVNPALGQRVSS